MTRIKTDSNSKNNSELMVIDFGLRKVLSQNFSKLVTIPKEVLIDNRTNQKAKQVNLQWIQEKGTTYIKIVPIFEIESTEI